MATDVVWTLGVWSEPLEGWVPIVTAPDPGVVRQLSEALQGASVRAVVVSSQDDDDAIGFALLAVLYPDDVPFNPHGRGSPEAD